MLGYARKSSLRARQSLRTSANSYVSRYLMPPQARFDEFCDVSPAKAPRSISATFAPREESDAAQTAPLIPPPSTSTSNCSLPSLSRLVSRSVGAGWLMRAKIHRLRYGSAVLGSPIAPMLAKLADG